MYTISKIRGGGGKRAAIAGLMREQSTIPYQTFYWDRQVQHRRTKRLKLGPRPNRPVFFFARDFFAVGYFSEIEGERRYGILVLDLERSKHSSL